MPTQVSPLARGTTRMIASRTPCERISTGVASPLNHRVSCGGFDRINQIDPSGPCTGRTGSLTSGGKSVSVALAS
jgi:hypothetical protein